MERILIKEVNKFVGKEVSLRGRITNIRKLGEISFIILQDYTGKMQIVWEKEIKAKVGDAIEIHGKIKEEKRAMTGFEMSSDKMEVISTSLEDYPLDLTNKELNASLTVLLDNRTLSLRHPKIQAIFKLYDLLLFEYSNAMREEGFTEIKTPKILETASEGGADFFKIKYFDKNAYLAQSPQFYKQIMVGVFERVFEVGSAFRAEPHFTTRHVNEYISLDGEMGFIDSFYDVTSMLNKILKKMFERMEEKGKAYLGLYGVPMPKVQEKIPHVKLDKVKEIIKKKYGYSIPKETDIDPEGERLAGRYAKEEFDSDFLFVTHYPWKDKPFYTMPDKDDSKVTCGFDLLFKGMEIVTGSQRIHLYKDLIENMKKKGVKPAGMEFYLDTFKFAMPPHGGWGMGSERIIQQILSLGSIKEAILFPRDVKRLNP